MSRDGLNELAKVFHLSINRSFASSAQLMVDVGQLPFSLGNRGD
jgi:hypothetical protein